MPSGPLDPGLPDDALAQRVPEVVEHRLTKLEENLMHESYLREQQHEQLVALLKLANQLTQRLINLENRIAGTISAIEQRTSQDAANPGATNRSSSPDAD
jgi:hypothetical protein